jgi:hypothetical protein
MKIKLHTRPNVTQVSGYRKEIGGGNCVELYKSIYIDGYTGAKEKF